MDGLEFRLHLTQGDKGKDGLSVLIGSKVAVGPQLVRCCKKGTRRALQISWHRTAPGSAHCPQGIGKCSDLGIER